MRMSFRGRSPRVVRRFATSKMINDEMNESIADGDADAPRARPGDALRVSGGGSVLVDHNCPAAFISSSAAFPRSRISRR